MTTIAAARHAADLASITLKLPAPVTAATDRATAFRELKRRPAPAPLGDLLAALEPVKWDEAITDHTRELAEHATITAAHMTAFESAERARVHEHLDDILAQFGKPIAAAVTDLTETGAIIPSRDAAECVAAFKGDALATFEKSLATLVAYARLLGTAVPKLRTPGVGVVRSELTVLDPGKIPVEILARDHINHRRVNTDDEAQVIDAARSALRTNINDFADLVAATAFGHTHLTLRVPTTRAEILAAQQRWSNAWEVRWDSE